MGKIKKSRKPHKPMKMAKRDFLSTQLNKYGRCGKQNKIKFATVQEARKYSKGLRKFKGAKTHPYYHKECESYHVGHDRHKTRIRLLKKKIATIDEPAPETA